MSNNEHTPISTMDVSLARIGDTAITLEQHQAGLSAVGEFVPSKKSFGDKASFNTLANTVDTDDPRLIDNYHPHTVRHQ